MSARTPEPMTPQQLAEIAARAEAATPGPWLLDPDGAFGSGTVVAEAGGTERLVGELGFGDGEEADADRSFTLHARTDVPWLLDRVNELTAANAEHVTANLEAANRAQIEIDRLRSENAELDRSLDEVIRERDELHEVADELAAAIAPADVLGEHSSHNDPWANALDYAAGQRMFEERAAATHAARAAERDAQTGGAA